MNILALEFSSDRRSVAVISETNPVRQVSRNAEPGSRQSHGFAMLDELLGERRDVDMIAVGLGPGSYSGIRAALALAQGWHLAQGVPVRGVSSMQALACEVEGTERFYVAADAQRGEFYLAAYEPGVPIAREIEPLRLATLEEIKALLNQGHRVCGPGLSEKLPAAEARYPTAAAVAALAAVQDNDVPPDQLEPIYLRPVAFVKKGRPL